jgi:hypothetical protein
VGVTGLLQLGRDCKARINQPGKLVSFRIQ